MGSRQAEDMSTRVPRKKKVLVNISEGQLAPLK